MAKKAYITKPSTFPSRQCPKCGKFYHARSKACPSCGAANPTRGSARKVKRVRRPGARRGAAGQRRSGRAGGSATLDAAIEFVQAAGGVEKAKAALEQIERIRRL